MNTGAKVTLIIGALLTLAGVGMFIPAYLSGADAIQTAENLGDDDVIDAAIWVSGDSQEIDYLDSWLEYSVYVKGDTDNLTIEVYRGDNTTNLFSACGEVDVNGWEVMCDDVANYRQVGAINLPDESFSCSTCIINVTGTGVVTVIDNEVMYEEVFSGFMDVVAASFAACCAICFGIIILMIGACVALFSNEPAAQPVMMASGPMVGTQVVSAAPGPVAVAPEAIAPAPVAVNAPTAVVPAAVAPAPEQTGVTLPPAEQNQPFSNQPSSHDEQNN